ncbi:MAG: HYR domain-containing protein [Chloroflexi bacterium]|nr:HYR domain-containing protein [Chloroflexota bacterium]
MNIMMLMSTGGFWLLPGGEALAEFYEVRARGGDEATRGLGLAMIKKCVLILAIGIFISGMVGNGLVGYVHAENGRTIVVISTSDSGPGTLRQALLEAQSGDTITFDPAVFPPEAPAAIYLAGSLRPLTQGDLTIDGGNAGVVLDGSSITDEGINGLTITSYGNIIRGLQIVNFPNAAVGLLGGAQDNVVGGDRSVGTGPLGQGNLLSGDGSFGVGVWDADTSSNTIIGNYIGTDLNGTASLNVRRDGVHMNGASHNQVIDNLISGNEQSGVYICCGAEGNTIRNNYIGTDISRLNPLGNLQSGVTIDQGARDNVIGPDNVVAHNSQDGISISGSNSLGNTITQNSIHDNGLRGIALRDGGNSDLPAPFIYDFDLAGGTATGAACGNCVVEIFSDSSNEGETYEGKTIADSLGGFALDKGVSFTGPYLTATATSADGNTGPFSWNTSGTSRFTNLQAGNSLPKTRLQLKQSMGLEDNRIGGVAEARHIGDWVWDTGLKWMRVIVDPYGQWQHVDWGKDEYSIDPEEERVIDDLLSNGVKIMLVLDVWHTDYRVVFYKSEEDIQLYLNWTLFMVRHFKGRIHYYEILNEPDLNFDAPSGIPLDSYANLIKRTAPIIRQEDPQAKIVVGALPDTRFDHVRDYMWGLLNSEAMSLVDGFSWHGMYGAAPSDDPRGVRQPSEPQMANYWENYPALVKEIMSVAASNGFTGEYLVEEMLWRTPSETHESEPYGFTDVSGAKYYARAIIIHLGLDVTTGLAVVREDVRPRSNSVIRALSTIMAGAETVSLPVEILSEATNIRSYSFSLPNGYTLVTLWTDGMAVDEDPGVKADLTLQGFAAQDVTGVDVLSGFQQPMIASNENGNLFLSDLLVRDYPLVLRLATDTTPPVLTVPQGLLVEATGPNGAVVTYDAMARDDVDGEVAAACTPPSGSLFPLGETTVTCAALDGAGNAATAAFQVAVQDTTPPTLTLPSPIVAEATGPDGGVVTYSATATDLVDGEIMPTCDPPSGSLFPVGVTTVTCTATDTSGNTETASFLIRVQDTTPPALTLPENITTEATGPAGTVVTFEVRATDVVDGSIAPTCDPPSGSLFPVGATTVTCTATDGTGNAATVSFSVTVLGREDWSLLVLGLLAGGGILVAVIAAVYLLRWRKRGETKPPAGAPPPVQ